MKDLTIAGRKIAPDQPPFIIAEMSGNHGHSLDRALALVDAAADAGADAIKTQTYTPDTMTLDIRSGAFVIDNPKSLWHGKSLYELYAEAMLPWEWHEAIFRRAQERGLIAFSTPFDATAVDFLEKLAVPCYKVASFELTDLELIQKIAHTGKPVIMSTGMATLAEISDAVNCLRNNGCHEYALLKCVSAYPARPESANLLTIPNMRETFQTQAGLSDHTLGVGVSIAAVALGAVIIEKHLTLDRKDGATDSAFSLMPQELATLAQECRNAWLAKGHVNYGVSDELEKSEKNSRRSLYIVNDRKAGERLTENDIRAIRPGFGLPIKHKREIIGRRLSKDVKRGTPLAWNLLD